MSNQATMAPLGAAMSYASADARPTARPAPRKESWLSRFYRALVRSRELQAQQIIERQLSRVSDDELAAMGYAPKDIARLRAAWPYGSSTFNGL